MTHIYLRDNEQYKLVTDKVSVDIIAQDVNVFVDKSPILDDLKGISVSLSRAIEEGNDLQLGIVIGQVLSKINEIINEVN
jgi:hypothetical protein